jgi:hypothetical protein
LHPGVLLKKFLPVLVAVAVVWTVASRISRHAADEGAPPPPAVPVNSPVAPVVPAETASDSFACDGRTYCSQMTSCAEAEYFLSHCPGTKMDGDHDGIPCERQWCGNR